MSTTIEQIRDEVAQAQARLAAAESKLRELEAKPAKWEPKGGTVVLTWRGETQDVFACTLDDRRRVDGSEYPTREAAESALPYVTFFKRLCCLAQELNWSGKVGGRYAVSLGESGYWRSIPAMGCADGLFQDATAAGKAADILNRDNWQLPAL